ncbi:MAG: hypothetical protein JSR77_03755 [Planctomycetes bacterium]|nr:hypothetical protein [Planctomycetota bacterium]
MEHSYPNSSEASLLFRPTDERQVAEILNDLSDIDGHLSDLAAKYKTMLPALVVWINTPEVQDRLNQISNTDIQLVRRKATAQLGRALSVAVRIMMTFECYEARVLVSPNNMAHIEMRRRAAETARRAATLVLRLSRAPDYTTPARLPRERTTPRPQPALPQESPDLRELQELFNSLGFAAPAAEPQPAEPAPATPPAPPPMPGAAPAEAATPVTPAAPHSAPVESPNTPLSRAAAASPLPAPSAQPAPSSQPAPRTTASPHSPRDRGPVDRAAPTPAASTSPPLRQAG